MKLHEFHYDQKKINAARLEPVKSVFSVALHNSFSQVVELYKVWDDPLGTVSVLSIPNSSLSVTICD